MRNFKQLLIAAAISISLTAVTAVAVAGSSNALAAQAECSHVGNHYLILEPTDKQPGTHEYWVCCICHTHWLNYLEGSWTEAGIAAPVDAEDDRFLEIDPRTELEKELDAAGFDYTNENGVITITHYDGDATTVVIPEGVSGIAAGSFSNTTVVSIELPSTIKTIDKNAFKDSGVSRTDTGKNMSIYLDMTEAEFNKAVKKFDKDWDAVCDESPLGWGWLIETQYADVYVKDKNGNWKQVTIRH